MFPSISTLTLLTTLLTITTSAPTPSSSDPKTHIYICTDASFQGPCMNMHLETSKCYNVSPEYNDKISSAGPDNGTFCTLYSDFDCRGKALPFTFPGVKQLGRYGYDDIVSSLRCDFITGWKSHP